MSIRSLIRSASPAALLLAAACASTSSAPSPEARAAELLSPRAAPIGRACEVLPIPATLPSATELVDVTALAADVRELIGEPEQKSGSVLLSLGYDRSGVSIRRAVIEHDVSPVVADSVQKLVFKHRRTLPETEYEWGVRMRLELEDPERPSVGRQEFCAPRPRDSQLGLAIESERIFGASTRIQNGQRVNTVWVRVRVTPEGLASNPVVERGMVPGAQAEQRLFDHVRSILFEPALVDGYPTSGFISVPIHLRAR